MTSATEAVRSGARPLYALESHGDCVTALPPGAVLLASSATAAVELWALGDTLLASQCHPELALQDVVTKARLPREEEVGRRSSFVSGGAGNLSAHF